MLHKSHNAPVPYPTMHHFVTEMCPCAHISVTKWCIPRFGSMHYGIRGMGLLCFREVVNSHVMCLSWRICRTCYSNAELWCFLDAGLNKILNTGSTLRWFDTPSRSCNVTAQPKTVPNRAKLIFQQALIFLLVGGWVGGCGCGWWVVVVVVGGGGGWGGGGGGFGDYTDLH